MLSLTPSPVKTLSRALRVRANAKHRPDTMLRVDLTTLDYLLLSLPVCTRLRPNIWPHRHPPSAIAGGLWTISALLRPKNAHRRVTTGAPSQSGLPILSDRCGYRVRLCAWMDMGPGQKRNQIRICERLPAAPPLHQSLAVSPRFEKYLLDIELRLTASSGPSLPRHPFHSITSAKPYSCVHLFRFPSALPASTRHVHPSGKSVS